MGAPKPGNGKLMVRGGFGAYRLQSATCNSRVMSLTKYLKSSVGKTSAQLELYAAMNDAVIGPRLFVIVVGGREAAIVFAPESGPTAEQIAAVHSARWIADEARKIGREVPAINLCGVQR